MQARMIYGVFIKSMAFVCDLVDEEDVQKENVPILLVGDNLVMINGLTQEISTR